MSPAPKTSLKLEPLEARDVPAIILQGTQTQQGPFPRPVTPNGGAVLIQEAIFAPTDIVVTRQANGTNFANASPATRNKSATANDAITITANAPAGDGFNIRASDGIFLRYSNNNGTFFQFVGTTLDVRNVSALALNLQLGGNDSVTLNGQATVPITLNTGAGADRVTLNGGTSPGTTVNGGAGNDEIIDNSTVGVVLNGGDGDDRITMAGLDANSSLTTFLSLQASGSQGFGFLPDLAPNANRTRTADGGAGADTITAVGLVSNLTIDGGSGDDTITGPVFGSFYTFRGGDGNDVIIGGLGLDVIDGGAGIDILFGQGGKDVYLAVDGGFDLLLNVAGDFAIADPFDIKNPV